MSWIVPALAGMIVGVIGAVLWLKKQYSDQLQSQRQKHQKALSQLEEDYQRRIQDTTQSLKRDYDSRLQTVTAEQRQEQAQLEAKLDTLKNDYESRLQGVTESLKQSHQNELTATANTLKQELKDNLIEIHPLDSDIRLKRVDTEIKPVETPEPEFSADAEAFADIATESAEEAPSMAALFGDQAPENPFLSGGTETLVTLESGLSAAVPADIKDLPASGLSEADLSETSDSDQSDSDHLFDSDFSEPIGEPTFLTERPIVSATASVASVTLQGNELSLEELFDTSHDDSLFNEDFPSEPVQEMSLESHADLVVEDEPHQPLTTEVPENEVAADFESSLFTESSETVDAAALEQMLASVSVESEEESSVIGLDALLGDHPGAGEAASSQPVLLDPVEDHASQPQADVFTTVADDLGDFSSLEPSPASALIEQPDDDLSSLNASFEDLFAEVSEQPKPSVENRASEIIGADASPEEMDIFGDAFLTEESTDSADLDQILAGMPSSESQEESSLLDLDGFLASDAALEPTSTPEAELDLDLAAIAAPDPAPDPAPNPDHAFTPDALDLQNDLDLDAFLTDSASFASDLGESVDQPAEVQPAVAEAVDAEPMDLDFELSSLDLDALDATEPDLDDPDLNALDLNTLDLDALELAAGSPEPSEPTSSESGGSEAPNTDAESLEALLGLGSAAVGVATVASLPTTEQTDHEFNAQLEALNSFTISPAEADAEPAAQPTATGALVPSMALSQIRTQLGHEDPQVRQSIAQEIAQIANRRKLTAELKPMIPVLGRLSQDTSPEVRTEAVKAMGKIQSVNVLPFLRRALRDSAPEVTQAAAVAIRQVKPVTAKAVKAVVKRTKR